MRYIKPQAITLASHPMLTSEGINLTITCLAGITMKGDFAELTSDQKIWKSLKGVLPAKIAPDLCFPKPQSEWLAFGRVYPDSVHATAATAGVTIKRNGRIISQKDLYINGNRHWRSIAGAGLPSEPKPLGGPFLLDWKFAYGGKGHPINPRGLGYYPDGWSGKALPNIEYREPLISSPMNHPYPAGFAPLPLDGSDRFKEQGKYNEEWRKNVFPGFSASASPEMMMMAPQDQQIEGVFLSGDVISCEGMSPTQSRLQWTIPSWQARCFIRLKGKSKPLVPVVMKLDTLWLIPNTGILGMMWRGSIEISEFDAHDVSLVLGALDDIHTARNEQFYEEQVQIRSGMAKQTAIMSLDETALLPLGQNGLIFPVIPPDVKKRIQKALDQSQESSATGKKSAQSSPPESKIVESDPAQSQTPTPEYIAKLSRELGEIAVSANPNVARFYEITKMLQSFGQADRHAQLKKVQEQSKAPKSAKPQPLNAGPPTRQSAALLAQIKAAQDKHISSNGLASDVDKKGLQQLLSASIDSYRKSAHLQPLGSPLLESAALLSAVEQGAFSKETQSEPHDWLGAKLDGQVLDGANFAGAFLDGSSFKGASLVGANFSGATLSRADFTGANLKGANFSDANLGRAILKDVNLEGARLDKAILDMAIFDAAKLSGASLKKTSFIRTSVMNTDFSGANLSGTKFMGIKLGMDAVALLQKPKINPNDFIEAIDFSNLDFTGANLSAATLLGCEVKGSGKFANANLSKATLIKCKFNDSNFSKANFSGVKVALGAQFIRCNFEGANFEGAYFRGVNLNHSNFNFANLNSSHFSLANMSTISATKISAVNGRFERTKLVQASLIASNLIGASFRNSNLTGANFDDSKMTHCDLSTIISDNKTSFIHADLSRALLPKQHIKR